MASCNLYECLREATAVEVLQGDCRYELANGRRVDARKRVLLDATPSILILHINRTAWQLSGVQKIHTHVDFPFDLEVGAFQNDEAQAACKYSLCSVVAHHGHQMSGGHFTAYGRGSAASHTWFQFNDARVTHATQDEVAGAQAYILLYERRL